jgi:hypothetical protein
MRRNGERNFGKTIDNLLRVPSPSEKEHCGDAYPTHVGKV